MSWIEWAATLLGVAYVVLMIRRNILCWVVGNISVTLQAMSFYTVRLYADMMLQGVYFVLGCYGFFRWLRKPPSHTSRDISRVESAGLWLLLIGLWVVGSIVWAWVLSKWTNALVPEIDATLATASLVATWMQARRYMENWLLWIGIDALYAVLYWWRGLYLYVVLYTLFVVLAWRGWKQWRSEFYALISASS